MRSSRHPGHRLFEVAPIHAQIDNVLGKVNQNGIISGDVAFMPALYQT